LTSAPRNFEACTQPIDAGFAGYAGAVRRGEERRWRPPSQDLGPPLAVSQLLRSFDQPAQGARNAGEHVLSPQRPAMRRSDTECGLAAMTGPALFLAAIAGVRFPYVWVVNQIGVLSYVIYLVHNEFSYLLCSQMKPLLTV
jgi:hypothetical protein